MLRVSNNVCIPDSELELSAVRSQGAGGQNVNKVATAIHLRFDIPNSSLPEFYKSRLMRCGDRRINNQGVIVIKAQRYRSQEQNRREAVERLAQLIENVSKTTKKRVPTKPTRSSRSRRMDTKTRRGQTKALRGKVPI